VIRQISAAVLLCGLLLSGMAGCAAASKPEVLDCMAREDSRDFRGAITTCQNAAIKYRESDVALGIAGRLPILMRLFELKGQIERQKERNDLLRNELKLRKRVQRMDKRLKAKAAGKELEPDESELPKTKR
jgi:hypothetical protein